MASRDPSRRVAGAFRRTRYIYLMPSHQTSLFGPNPPPAIEPAPHPQRLRDLAKRIPASLRFGTSSWSFPGWAGQIYANDYSTSELAKAGLSAYAQHPLLRAVGIDRTWYSPISATLFRRYAEQVPDSFRFLVKAHQDCTNLDIPDRERAWNQRDPNPHFLDVDYAVEHVVQPYLDGLGHKGGVLLFQFAPQDFSRIGGPEGFQNVWVSSCGNYQRGPRTRLKFATAN